jgi:hypothetical protein
MLIHCCGNVFTAPLLSNGHIHSFHYSGFQPSCRLAPCLRLPISSSLQEYCHFFFPFEGTNLSKVAGAPTVLARKLGSLFFHTGRGLLLHDVLSFVFGSLMKDPTVSFMTSSSRVCPGVSFGVLLLPRCSCRFMPWSLMLLQNVLPSSLQKWFS